MPHPVVFRPRGGVILAVVAIVLCLAVLVSIVVTDGMLGLLAWGWPVIAIAWLAWLLYIRPSVTLTDGFIEVVNPVRTHRVPWGDVFDVESRYALTVTTHDKRTVRAWAAPAPGARQALSTRREDVRRAPGEGETHRPSDAEGTDSGDATALVLRGLEQYRRSGAPHLPGGTVSTWAIVPLLVTVALVAAAVVSLAQAVAHG
ncbi:PH domain-containing protein [Microbacterium sp. LjRoot45]|uniref:PH domain-containing protein n=1 Tax=Microbacterium sp. LjRoot45 TaxID=3342329 RepID=UPI003ED0426F